MISARFGRDEVVEAALTAMRPGDRVQGRRAVPLLEIVRGEDHGDAAGLEPGEQFPGPGAGLGVQSCGGFVEEDDTGVVEQGAGEVEASLLAAGEGADAGGEPVGQVDLGEDLVGGGRGVEQVPAHMRMVSATVSSLGSPPFCSMMPRSGRTRSRSVCGSWPKMATLPSVAAASPR